MQDDRLWKELGLRVLVVEDEALIAMETESMLSRLGCTAVGPAPTVARALWLLERETVDVAVLDVNLCGERSTPVAEALLSRGVPFALATGYAAGQLPEEPFQRVPHLGKPIQFQVLHQFLQEMGGTGRRG